MDERALVEYEEESASSHEALPSAPTTPSGRVVHIEGFEPAVALDSAEQDAYRRRFVTLFMQDGRACTGGSAKVSRVANIWGEVYALKVLNIEKLTADHPDDLARRAVLEEAFRREYRLQCAVSGLEGFPRVYGFGTVEGACAIVMEWVEGITLSKAARMLSVDDEGRMSPLAAARLGRDLFDLLVRLGFVEGGVAHRDISTGNVMVRTDRMALGDQVDEGVFDLCLLDFGSAAPATSEALSAAGSGATWDYAAPELLRGDFPQDRFLPAADAYAAASVVWQLATGAPPYSVHDVSPQEALEAKEAMRLQPWQTAHAKGDISATLLREPEVAVAFRQAAADLPAAPLPSQAAAAFAKADAPFGSVLAACLAPDPQQRPSAAKVRDALGSFAFHYAENIGRALRGEPLVPLVPGSLADGYGGRAQRRRTIVRVVGKALSAALGLAVAVLAGVLVGANTAPFSNWPISGVAAGCATTLALMLPFAAGAALRWRTRGGIGLARGAAGVLLGAAAAIALGCASAPTSDELRAVLAGACLACSAASWCYLAMDFVVPAPGRLGSATACAKKGEPPLLEESAKEIDTKEIVQKGGDSHGV